MLLQYFSSNVSINTSTVFPPMGSSGFILVEVSASGYGNSGSNGLIAVFSRLNEFSLFHVINYKTLSFFIRV